MKNKPREKLQRIKTSVVYRLFNPQVPVVICARYGRSVAAMSANSCVSISEKPSLVALSVRRGSRTGRIVAKSKAFSINWVNFNPREQRRVILDMSKPSTLEPDKLQAFGVPYGVIRGSPVLDNAVAYALCQVESVQITGDHDLFIAKVESAKASSDFTKDEYWRFEKYKPVLYLGSIRKDPLITI